MAARQLTLQEKEGVNMYIYIYKKYLRNVCLFVCLFFPLVSVAKSSGARLNFNFVLVSCLCLYVCAELASK